MAFESQETICSFHLLPLSSINWIDTLAVTMLILSCQNLQNLILLLSDARTWNKECSNCGHCFAAISSKLPSFWYIWLNCQWTFCFNDHSCRLLVNLSRRNSAYFSTHIKNLPCTNLVVLLVTLHQIPIFSGRTVF